MASPTPQSTTSSRFRPQPFRLAIGVLGLIIFCQGLIAGPPVNVSSQRGEEEIQYGEPRHLASLKSNIAEESSGLAVSRRRPDVFWTHNDSGDVPRIIAFDTKGEILTSCQIMGAHAEDWEDMASFTWHGKPYLLLADTGDNRRQHSQHKLYLVEEPMFDQKTAPITRTIRFSYEDGPHDCESVAFDPTSDSVLLCTKTLGLTCEIFQFEMPAKKEKGVQVARVIAKPMITAATSMDISPDGRRAIILTYASAYEFARHSGETWAQAFRRSGRRIEMPERKQGESICYGSDGQTLYLTSEKLPTPLWQVPVVSAR